MQTNTMRRLVSTTFDIYYKLKPRTYNNLTKSDQDYITEQLLRLLDIHDKAEKAASELRKEQ